MTDKTNMREAAPHIERAHRSLEMLALFVENKDRLSLAKRVPNYIDILFDCVLELQRILLTDNEYTERVTHGLMHVSRNRELAYNVTDNRDGDVFYAVNGMLPLKDMKANVLFSGRMRHE